MKDEIYFCFSIDKIYNDLQWKNISVHWKINHFCFTIDNFLQCPLKDDLLLFHYSTKLTTIFSRKTYQSIDFCFTTDKNYNNLYWKNNFYHSIVKRRFPSALSLTKFKNNLQWKNIAEEHEHYKFQRKRLKICKTMGLEKNRNKTAANFDGEAASTVTGNGGFGHERWVWFQNKMAIPGLFLSLFSSYNYNFTINKCEKCPYSI